MGNAPLLTAFNKYLYTFLAYSKIVTADRNIFRNASLYMFFFSENIEAYLTVSLNVLYDFLKIRWQNLKVVIAPVFWQFPYQ